MGLDPEWGGSGGGAGGGGGVHVSLAVVGLVAEHLGGHVAVGAGLARVVEHLRRPRPAAVVTAFPRCSPQGKALLFPTGTAANATSPSGR